MTHSIRLLSEHLRLCSVILGFLFLSACSSVHENAETKYPISVQQTPHILTLPVEGEFLTPAQERRLARFAQTYRINGESEVSIASPEGHDTRLKVNQIAATLNSNGVEMNQIISGDYKTTEIKSAPEIFVSFTKTTAVTRSCDDQWDSDQTGLFTNNAQSKGFGCASQNNLAVMLEDPNDIIASRPSTPVQAESRARVIDAFIKGEPTTTQALEASGTQE
jgi:pilus assembly protein CpaD